MTASLKRNKERGETFLKGPDLGGSVGRVSRNKEMGGKRRGRKEYPGKTDGDRRAGQSSGIYREKS